jgi:secreted trypsin-like serine protease
MRPWRSIRCLLAATCVPLLLAPAAVASEPEARMSVVGGRPATAAAWPFMAGLVRSAEPDTFQAQFCGGSLVSARAVLTAAHCVSDLAPSQVQIVTGTHLSPSQPRLAVQSIAVHPSYQPSAETPEHDLAVLTLAQPHAFATVALAGPGEDASAQPASVAGWGNLQDATSNAFTKDLQQGDFFLDGALCADSPWRASAWVLCADTFSDLAVSPCIGDSGGPLVSNGKLVGVVSMGPAHCHGQSYYARVSAERAFLDAAVAAAGGAPATAGTPAPVATPEPAALFLGLAEARSVTRQAVRRHYGVKARTIACSRRSATRVGCRFSIRKQGRTIRRRIDIREWTERYTYRITS